MIDPDARVTVWNDAAERMFGYTREEAQGQALLSASAVRVRGRWHAVGILRDITDRLKVEEALWKAKEETEEANTELQRSVERANRRVLSGILESRKCRHTEVDNGAAALAHLRAAARTNDPYRIAILDMVTQDIPGEDLGRQIKADSVIAGTTLVMMTSVGAGDRVYDLYEGFRYGSLSMRSLALAGRRRADILGIGPSPA